MNAIQVKNVTYNYQQTNALTNLSLDIPENTSCAIIGPSGCGKTTLLHAMAGFLIPTEGEIFFYKERVTKFPKETSILLQDYALFPWKTVFENISLGLKIKKKVKNGNSRANVNAFKRARFTPSGAQISKRTKRRPKTTSSYRQKPRPKP
ncbi:ATP-binding cassette domain-containing protein [Listeria fleischmannii]|uniref:ATP-binding cassette domain-containing protein n=1 Tax=Listeria fleischmannii TaxID=1069827 RepID=UPI00345E9144